MKLSRLMVYCDETKKLNLNLLFEKYKRHQEMMNAMLSDEQDECNDKITKLEGENNFGR